jgi:hypothetical protein
MSDGIQLKAGEESPPISSRDEAAVKGSEVCPVEKKGWLKRMLHMGICCTAPLLLALAIPLFGASLGAVVGGFLSIAAVLACPLVMYFMMRMMNKEK